MPRIKSDVSRIVSAKKSSGLPEMPGAYPFESGEHESWKVRAQERSEAPRHMLAFLWAEDALQYLVAAALIIVAGAVLVHSVIDTFKHDQQFAVVVPNVINSVLFVVIVLELFGTVISHFRSGGFQLRPFLIIGIISGVRHILTVGAQSIFGGKTVEAVNGKEFAHTMIEFGVNVGIVLGLVLALVLVTRFHADQTH